MPPVDVDDDAYARGVGIVLEQGRSFDLLSSRDVARAVQSVRQTQAHRAQDEQREGLRIALTEYVRGNVARLTADADVDNRARLHSGKPPLPVDVAAHAIALDAIKNRIDVSALNDAEIDKTVNKVRESHPTLFGAPQAPQPSTRERVSELVRRADELGASIQRDGRGLTEKARSNTAGGVSSSPNGADPPAAGRKGPRPR